MMDNIKESVISSQFRSDDDNEDETTYNYDDELVMDSDDDAVQAGETFIEDGREWQWIKQIGDVEHIDFDNWAVWFATDVDNQDGGYFVVDVDTGFIDWGPCDTKEEATDFLDSKKYDDDDEDIDFSITDYEDDYYVNESVETLKEDSLDDKPWSREQAINRIISMYEDASDDYQDYIVSELVRLSGFPDESYIGGIDIDEPVWERISDKQLMWLDNTISLDDSNKRKVDNLLMNSKEILQEDDSERVSATIPNDLLNNPDKVDFKSYIGKRSADAKAEKERQEKEARMAERASKYKDAIDHAQELMERDDTIEALDVLFDALVPQSGPADTVAGELVRAMMRILHRDYNDGDLFYEGYGIETCGSSVAYIIDVIGDQLIDTFEKIALRQLQDDSYTQALKEVTKAVVKAILNNNEYITTDNEEDSRSRKWEQDYEDRFKDDWEPRYDYSFDVADKIYEHIHEGNITMQDVVSRMEDNLMYQSGFDGVEVYSSGEDLIIDNLTRDALEELEDWNRDSDRYWSDYIDELNDEYGDPDDDLSDEELDESKSIKEEHDILSANELADKVFTALNNCNISGYGNYIDRANDSVQLYPKDEDISEEITDCLKSDFVFEIDRYGHIIVTDLKSLLEPKESLNLDSDGKRLKKLISQLVLDSDEELRDYVNKIVDEVIEERNNDTKDESLTDSVDTEHSSDGYVYTYCDGCGKRNRVKVVFKDYKSPFNDTEYICKYCGTRNLLTDPHKYDDDGYIIESNDTDIDDVQDTNQKYTSAKTSINSSKLPAIFNMINLQPGTINLDFGGGKFDNVAEYLADKDITNLVYDPYNRSSEHNKEVIAQVKANGGADSATISNVLNVIAEEAARNIVLNNVYRLTKPDATIYITVYEGDSSGNPGETKSGYQLNRKTADYMEEIEKVFPNVVRKGKLIIAKK